eukprot:1187822-Prorocentrum_minimum.AAC.4
MKLYQFCLFIVLAIFVVSSNGMMPGMGGGKKKDKAPSVKGDIKYIKCSVCEEIAKFLHREVKKMRDELPKNKKVRILPIAWLMSALECNMLILGICTRGLIA